jgi:hypothetical protein
LPAVRTIGQARDPAYADGGTRTRTALSGQRILSPLRLPFRHIGARAEANEAARPWTGKRIFYGELNGRDFRGDTTTVNRSHAIGCLGLSPIQLMVGLVDLGPKNRDLFRCFDTNLYCVTVNSGDFDMDRITNHNTLVYLSR